MDYYSVSCNRGASLVSRGGIAVYDFNPSRWVDSERLAQKNVGQVALRGIHAQRVSLTLGPRLAKR